MTNTKENTDLKESTELDDILQGLKGNHSSLDINIAAQRLINWRDKAVKKAKIDELEWAYVNCYGSIDDRIKELESKEGE